MNLLNGVLLVKTYTNRSGYLARKRFTTPTSIITIPNANTSDSLLRHPAFLNTSGEVYRAVIPHSSEALSCELISCTKVARPKSAIRAFPFISISMFACTDHHKHEFVEICSSTHSFEVSMDYIA